MATTPTTLTKKVKDGSPYQLDAGQVLNASNALLNHMKKMEVERMETVAKKGLLDEDNQMDETPIWLNFTTKRHIRDEKRLKPVKIVVPHPLNTSTTTTICLITADPQRTYKDIVASPAFPAELRTRITRVIGVKKVKAKYHQYEAQRQLLASHDMFLADDRIITHLPKLLGKTFYKTTAKRPVPINIQGRPDGNRTGGANASGAAKETITPQNLAAEIERTLGVVLVALSASTLTSVRIGFAGWPAEKIAANIESVTNELITKLVPQKWKNVRAIHIKGPETAALPIWLADELWVDEDDLLEDETEENALTISEAPNVGRKRKAIDDAEEEPKVEKVKKAKKAKKAHKADKAKLALPRGSDDNLDKEMSLRKERLKRQKAEAVAAANVEDETPKVKKAKKVKKVGKVKKVTKVEPVEE